MTEREAYSKLLEVYGQSRARTLLGTLRLLSLYSREDIAEGNLLSRTTLHRDLADLRAAGVSERLETIHLEQAVTEYVFSRADEFARALSDRRLVQTPLSEPLQPRMISPAIKPKKRRA